MPASAIAVSAASPTSRARGSTRPSTGRPSGPTTAVCQSEPGVARALQPRRPHSVRIDSPEGGAENSGTSMTTTGRVRGGFNQYGFTVGILMLDTRFPRIPGDMGHAATFPFPVRYHRIAGASPDLVVRRGAAGLLDAFIEGARQLEREGVGAVTTNCGFLVKHQAELAVAVRVPVLTSSLLLVPLVHRMLPPGRTVGILTVNAPGLA